MFFRNVMLVFLSGAVLDGKLFNLRRLQAKSKVQTDVLDKLLYADDLTENAKSETTMQGAVDCMPKACDNFHLTISTKKTEIVNQPAPGKLYSEPTITVMTMTVNGQKLQVVDKFTYLGALSPEQCSLMIRLQPELQKSVYYLTYFAHMSGNEMKSDLTLS